MDTVLPRSALAQYGLVVSLAITFSPGCAEDTSVEEACSENGGEYGCRDDDGISCEEGSPGCDCRCHPLTAADQCLRTLELLCDLACPCSGEETSSNDCIGCTIPGPPGSPDQGLSTCGNLPCPPESREARCARTVEESSIYAECWSDLSAGRCNSQSSTYELPESCYPVAGVSPSR